MVTGTERRHAKEARADQATQDQSRRQRQAKERRDNMMALRNVLFIACCVGQYDFAKSDDRGNVTWKLPASPQVRKKDVTGHFY
jgi:hypothetical protein